MGALMRAVNRVTKTSNISEAARRYGLPRSSVQRAYHEFMKQQQQNTTVDEFMPQRAQRLVAPHCRGGTSSVHGPWFVTALGSSFHF